MSSHTQKKKIRFILGGGGACKASVLWIADLRICMLFCYSACRVRSHLVVACKQKLKMQVSAELGCLFLALF